ncbi:MAG TPA: glycosyltransferase family 2 protein [Burkholderiales bacterium]
MTADVSVVVPCYRSAETVGETIDSAFAQTIRPLELIAVDDASPDGTAQVLEERQRACGADWLKIVRLPVNRGVASARNAGWAAARGAFVAFVDSDETWHPRKVEIQHGFMRRHPEIAISAHRTVRRERGAAPAAVADHPPVRYPPAWSVLFKNLFGVRTVMLRKELPYRFLEGRRHMEDHLLWMTMALRGERIALLDAPLASIHKAPYGASGLSAELWRMEKGDLDNYRLLHREGLISLPAMAGLQVLSLAKFARRAAVTAAARLAR